jgi:hypothetical protein
VNWRLVGAYLFLSAGAACAQAPESPVVILPDGNVQIKRGGPELDAGQFRQLILRMKQETPVPAIHIYVRSSGAFSHLANILEQIKRTGFDMKKVMVD